ncbi:phage antirepressor KilAC domain-containing protein [Bacillus rhizoplanae]|uniref:phage antirepressor KilAC domain-containing protein n=1 Tax=Bacillus rhizoplanae TaxID=2880966 RepID=UPI003D255C66
MILVITFTVVGKNFLDGMSAVDVRKFLQEEGVLFNRKVDGVYAPKRGYEKYFRVVPYVGYGYGNARKVVTRTLKVTNEGIDFIVDLSKQKVAYYLNR